MNLKLAEALEPWGFDGLNFIPDCKMMLHISKRKFYLLTRVRN